MAANSLRGSGLPSASCMRSSIGMAASCQGAPSSSPPAPWRRRPACAPSSARGAGLGVERQQAGEEAVEPGALLDRERRVSGSSTCGRLRAIFVWIVMLRSPSDSIGHRLERADLVAAREARNVSLGCVRLREVGPAACARPAAGSPRPSRRDRARARCRRPGRSRRRRRRGSPRPCRRCRRRRARGRRAGRCRRCSAGRRSAGSR